MKGDGDHAHSSVGRTRSYRAHGHMGSDVCGMRGHRSLWPKGHNAKSASSTLVNAEATFTMVSVCTTAAACSNQVTGLQIAVHGARLLG